jgi:uncharacterized protein VirK/YbjX
MYFNTGLILNYLTIKKYAVLGLGGQRCLQCYAEDIGDVLLDESLSLQVTRPEGDFKIILWADGKAVTQLTFPLTEREKRHLLTGEGFVLEVYKKEVKSPLWCGEVDVLP